VGGPAAPAETADAVADPVEPGAEQLPEGILGRIGDGVEADETNAPATPAQITDIRAIDRLQGVGGLKAT